ncbi:hypothetical protein ACOME3_009231 [Neoechinorhynchus agilis]
MGSKSSKSKANPRVDAVAPDYYANPPYIYPPRGTRSTNSFRQAAFNSSYPATSGGRGVRYVCTPASRSAHFPSSNGHSPTFFDNVYNPSTVPMNGVKPAFSITTVNPPPDYPKLATHSNQSQWRYDPPMQLPTPVPMSVPAAPASMPDMSFENQFQVGSDAKKIHKSKGARKGYDTIVIKKRKKPHKRKALLYTPPTTATTQDIIEEMIPPSKVIIEQVPIGYTTTQTVIQPPPQAIHVTTQKFIVIDVCKNQEGLCIPRLSVLNTDQLKTLADSNGLIPLDGKFRFINQADVLPLVGDSNVLNTINLSSQAANREQETVDGSVGVDLEKLTQLLTNQFNANETS